MDGYGHSCMVRLVLTEVSALEDGAFTTAWEVA